MPEVVPETGDVVTPKLCSTVPSMQDDVYHKLCNTLPKAKHVHDKFNAEAAPLTMCWSATVTPNTMLSSCQHRSLQLHCRPSSLAVNDKHVTLYIHAVTHS